MEENIDIAVTIDVLLAYHHTLAVASNGYLRTGQFDGLNIYRRRVECFSSENCYRNHTTRLEINRIDITTRLDVNLNRHWNCQYCIGG